MERNLSKLRDCTTPEFERTLIADSSRAQACPHRGTGPTRQVLKRMISGCHSLARCVCFVNGGTSQRPFCQSRNGLSCGLLGRHKIAMLATWSPAENSEPPSKRRRPGTACDRLQAIPTSPRLASLTAQLIRGPSARHRPDSFRDAQKRSVCTPAAQQLGDRLTGTLRHQSLWQKRLQRLWRGVHTSRCS